MMVIAGKSLLVVLISVSGPLMVKQFRLLCFVQFSEDLNLLVKNFLLFREIITICNAYNHDERSMVYVRLSLDNEQKVWPMEKIKD